MVYIICVQWQRKRKGWNQVLEIPHESKASAVLNDRPSAILTLIELINAGSVSMMLCAVPE
jgi:hypothetical protein